MLSVVCVKVTLSSESLCTLCTSSCHYLLTFFSAYLPVIGPDGGGRGGASETTSHRPRART